MSRPLIRTSRKARACANCRHFAEIGTALVIGGHGVLGIVGHQARGECRAAAPTRDRKTGNAVWPVVVASEWCAGFTRVGTGTGEQAA